MEGATDLKGDDSLSAPGSGQFSGTGQRVGGTADRNLAGAIDVGDLNPRGIADVPDRGLVEPYEGEHSPGVLLSGFLHKASSLSGQEESVFEGQYHGCDEGGVLAQTVAGHEGRDVGAGRGQLIAAEIGYADGEYGRLGIDGLTQYILGPFEAQS